MATEYHPALEEVSEGTRIRLRIQPKARGNALVGLYGSSLKIRIQAPPVDGQANQALLTFLAELLGVKKSEVLLQSGTSSRDKAVLIRGIPAAEVARRLSKPV